MKTLHYRSPRGGGVSGRFELCFIKRPKIMAARCASELFCAYARGVVECIRGRGNRFSLLRVPR